jgi:YrbI family 3-deoxy-D-manno-octulosonate 8-phosphate phosphatase
VSGQNLLLWPSVPSMIRPVQSPCAAAGHPEYTPSVCGLSALSVVAIIPARGGSKGIPRKNLVLFRGQPLVMWSIRQALAAESITEVVVSSDDAEILNLAERAGARAVRRPANLSSDDATTESALLHVLDSMAEQGEEEPELVVVLQPTSPLREPSDIDGAVSYLRSCSADSLFSGTAVEAMLWTLDEEGVPRPFGHDPTSRIRRQDLGQQFHEDGSIYVFRPGTLRAHGHRLGGDVVMYRLEPTWKRFEVDEPGDLDLCAAVASSLLPRIALIPLADLDGIVYDFDGVLTDNRVLTLEDGREAALANRGDGLAIAALRAIGVRQLILSSEENPIVVARGAKMNIPVLHGVSDKLTTLVQWAAEHGVSMDRLLYVGNDLNDLEVMGAVGYSVAPADAHPHILNAATITLRAQGGEGVVRELIHEHLETP